MNRGLERSVLDRLESMTGKMVEFLQKMIRIPAVNPPRSQSVSCGASDAGRRACHQGDSAVQAEEIVEGSHIQRLYSREKTTRLHECERGTLRACATNYFEAVATSTGSLDSSTLM